MSPQVNKKAVIQAVCAVTSDKLTLQIASFATMRSGGRADKFLQHYLDGTASPQYVDILTLLREDSGVLKVVTEFLQATLRQPATISTGNIPLPQPVFTNQDWLFAIGSINLTWKLLQRDQSRRFALVELSFRNEYRWHPKEARISQCVHQAADRLKWLFAKSSG